MRCSSSRGPPNRGIVVSLNKVAVKEMAMGRKRTLSQEQETPVSVYPFRFCGVTLKLLGSPSVMHDGTRVRQY